MNIRGQFISDSEKAKAYFSIRNLPKNLRFASQYNYMHECFFNFFKPVTTLFLIYISVCVCFFLANPFFSETALFASAFYYLIFAFITHSVMLFFRIKKYFYTELQTYLSEHHCYQEFLVFHKKSLF